MILTITALLKLLNSNHMIKKVSQEISFIADQVHQIEKEVQSSRLVKILFLNNLSKQYENFCQLLKFHVKILNQMIKILFTVKAHMKNENKTLYDMNIVTEKSAR